MKKAFFEWSMMTISSLCPNERCFNPNRTVILKNSVVWTVACFGVIEASTCSCSNADSPPFAFYLLFGAATAMRVDIQSYNWFYTIIILYTTVYKNDWNIVHREDGEKELLLFTNVASIKFSVPELCYCSLNEATTWTEAWVEPHWAASNREKWSVPPWLH